MFQRDLATNAIIEFLNDESNQQVLEGLRSILRKHPELNRDLAIRSTVLGQMGMIPLEPGARMGLMVRFIEMGLSLVDWDQVIRELELDSKSEQEEVRV